MINIPTSFNIDLEFESADIIKRFVAWLIDLAIRLCYFLITYMVLTSFHLEFAENTIIYILFILLPLMLYFLISEISMSGQTPGKKVVHIKVVSMIGNPPGISQHLIRWIFRLIESPLLFSLIVPVIVPFVSIIRSRYKQRLGDLIAGTIVISTQKKGSIAETIFRDFSTTNYTPQFSQIMKLSDRDLNKVKELLDRALIMKDTELAYKVALRVKTVLHITSELPHIDFLETVLNDYNYYTTKDS